MTTELQIYKAQYCWTEREFIKSSKLNGRIYLRPSIRIAANITALFLIAISILILVIDGLNSSAGIMPLVIITLCLCWLLRNVGTNWWLGRIFRKRPEANVLMKWEFAQDEVKTHCENLSFGSFSWKLISKLVETTDGFLFYVNGVCLWIPFTAFEKQEGIRKVREFVKINGVKYIQTKG